ncbi:unnamed protein product, partial [Polarella glacialis]
ELLEMSHEHLLEHLERQSTASVKRFRRTQSQSGIRSQTGSSASQLGSERSYCSLKPRATGDLLEELIAKNRNRNQGGRLFNAEKQAARGFEKVGFEGARFLIPVDPTAGRVILDDETRAEINAEKLIVHQLRLRKSRPRGSIGNWFED